MKFAALTLLIILLALANIYIGSVEIPPGEVTAILTGRESDVRAFNFIVIDSRLPQAITAIVAGAALAISGLLLQTAFRNPLASPSLLGITSGASLGVAIVTLLSGGVVAIGSFAFGGMAAVMGAAFVGSMATMALLLLLSSLLRNDLLLLITGVLLGYLVSSIITLLNFNASATGVQSYILWGMGTFSGLTLRNTAIFAAITFAGLVIAVTLVKPLNLLQLGSGYARSLGVNLSRVRNLLLLSTGILTSATTAYCGPVAFIGLAVPHITRIIFPTANHRILLPATILTGSAVALLCNLICVLPASGLLPLNAVTPLIGVPVIIYVILSRR